MARNLVFTEERDNTKASSDRAVQRAAKSSDFFNTDAGVWGGFNGFTDLDQNNTQVNDNIDGFDGDDNTPSHDK